jgi:hypothetical protein
MVQPRHNIWGGSDPDYKFIAGIKQNYEATAISSKMKALLAAAGKDQKGAKYVTGDDVPEPGRKAQPTRRSTMQS